MKFNHKNRPRREGLREHYSDRQMLDAMNKWADNQEKELRELISEDFNLAKFSNYHPTMMVLKDFIDKEVLG